MSQIFHSHVEPFVNFAHFSLFFLFLLFETFKPTRTFAQLDFKERLNFNSKTLCSQFLSRNRLLLDDFFSPNDWFCAAPLAFFY